MGFALIKEGKCSGLESNRRIFIKSGKRLGKSLLERPKAKELKNFATVESLKIDKKVDETGY